MILFRFCRLMTRRRLRFTRRPALLICREGKRRAFLMARQSLNDQVINTAKRERRKRNGIHLKER